MQTGLHRNTISKVYRQLEDNGLVDSRAGSGIYVTAQSNGPNQVSEPRTKSPCLQNCPTKPE